MHTTKTSARLRLCAGIGVTLAMGIFLVAGTAFAAGPAAPDLGTAGSFAVLAGAGITNTGPTTIKGDVGTYPTTTETGFGSVTLNGTDHAGDAVTQGAKTDLTTAYTTAAGAGPTIPVVGDLGGQTLTPGVYNTATSLALTGTLTLSGTSSDVWIFQAGSTLTTASGSSVVFSGGATPCNVFWQIGSSATIGTGSAFKGTIMALTSITLTTGATIDGRALARNGAVTLDTNTITNSCSAASAASATPAATPAASAASATPAASAASATPAASAVPNTAFQGDGTVASWPAFAAILLSALLLGLVVFRTTLAAERRKKD